MKDRTENKIIVTNERRVRNYFTTNVLNNLENKRSSLTTKGDEFINQIKSHEILVIDLSEKIDWSGFGLSSDDVLIVTIDREIQEDRLSLFYNERGKHLRLGFAFENFGEISVNENDGDIDRYKNKDFTYIGYVSQIITAFQPPKIYGENKIETPVTTNEEISVKCDGCEKEASGSKAFLAAMAWRLKKNETLCVSCW